MSPLRFPVKAIVGFLGLSFVCYFVSYGNDWLGFDQFLGPQNWLWSELTLNLAVAALIFACLWFLVGERPRMTAGFYLVAAVAILLAVADDLSIFLPPGPLFKILRITYGYQFNVLTNVFSLVLVASYVALNHIRRD